MDKGMLHIQMTREEARQIQYLLNRALNTLDPKSWPPVAKELDDALFNFLDKIESTHDAV